MAGILDIWRHGRRRDALVRVLRPAMPALYRLAYRLTGQEADAEDLLQDLVVRLYDRADEIARLDRPEIWLSRVLYRLYLDDRRRRGRRPVPVGELAANDDDADPVADHPDDPGLAPEALHERGALGERLTRALARLPEAQRIAVILHDVEGYRLAEIAAITGAAEGTVKSRLHRARRELRGLLSDGTL
ncbi:RNA polymerase sigma factor SigE [Salinisphaera sp. PC39]|uniref:RNA polymerase sigma factor n=1 Tax=Salinisphaera sp. PC39 TaxID=1304156 RepID=UPI00333F9479